MSGEKLAGSIVISLVGGLVSPGIGFGRSPVAVPSVYPLK